MFKKSNYYLEQFAREHSKDIFKKIKVDREVSKVPDAFQFLLSDYNDLKSKTVKILN